MKKKQSSQESNEGDTKEEKNGEAFRETTPKESSLKKEETNEKTFKNRRCQTDEIEEDPDTLTMKKEDLYKYIDSLVYEKLETIKELSSKASSVCEVSEEESEEEPEPAVVKKKGKKRTSKSNGEKPSFVKEWGVSFLKTIGLMSAPIVSKIAFQNIMPSLINRNNSQQQPPDPFGRPQATGFGM